MSDSATVAVPPAKRPADPAVRQPRLRVRTILFGLVLAAVLPLWAYAGLLAYQFNDARRAVVDEAASRTTRALAGAVDFRLESLQSMMTGLSLSASARRGDHTAFYGEMRAVAQSLGLVLALVDAEGQQVLNTNAPLGTALPPAVAATPYRAAIEQGKPQVSELFFGNVTPRWLVAIVVPFTDTAGASFALVSGLDAERSFGALVDRVDLPDGWAMAVVDSSHRILARRPYREGLTGSMGHPSLFQAISASRSGVGQATTVDGVTSRVFFHRLESSGWIALVGVPQAEIDNAARDAMRPIVLAGFVALVGSLVLAWIIGQYFSRPIARLATMANAYRSGVTSRPAAVASPGIIELADLQASLETAMAARNAQAAEQVRALQEKELMMQESHHRVKNSLQLVRGILNLQSRTAESAETRDALTQASARILTVAEVHHHLYQGGPAVEASVKRYITDLVRELSRSMLAPDEGRLITINADDAIWPSEKVTALGLVVAELVINAIKYGQGQITVTLRIPRDGNRTLVVEDEGSGFPEGVMLGAEGGLGSRIIASLIPAPHGTFDIDRSVAHTRIVVTLLPTWREAVTAQSRAT
jgi:two-component sensor histidine kinase